MTRHQGSTPVSQYDNLLSAFYYLNVTSSERNQGRSESYIRMSRLSPGATLPSPRRVVPQFERAAVTVRGRPAVPGLELRVPGALCEERGERRVQVPQCQLQRHAGHLADKRQARGLLHGGQRPAGPLVLHARAIGLPAGMPGGHGMVPHHPDAAERAVQHLLLRRAGQALHRYAALTLTGSHT